MAKKTSRLRGARKSPRIDGDSPHRLQYRGQECLIPELNMVGWDRFRVAAPGALDEHSHPDAYEFCYLVSGSVDWWVEDSVQEVRPGEVYLTRPGERHGGIDAVMHPCELYWVQVNHVTASKFAEGSLTQWIERLSLRSFPGSRSLRERFDTLMAEHRSQAPLRVVAARAALHSLLVTIVRDHDAFRTALDERSAATSPEMRRAMHWLEKHAAEDFAIHELAAVAGLGASRFYERFLKEIGYTPAEYRSRIRVTQAKRLLRDGRRAITDIAFDLGFSSSQYFATVFKNHSGLTPREYQERAGSRSSS